MRDAVPPKSESVVGALLGAKHGKRAIPQRWLDVLDAARELTLLGEQLYAQL
jgi:ADP-ribosylglycohydrolase